MSPSRATRRYQVGEHSTAFPEANVLPALSPDEEYCTVVFHLQGGRRAMGWFLAELSRHFEGSGTAEIVRFEVGDHLGPRN
ncbi:hypothetical protein N5O88_10235 [Pseudomonas sp. GD03721]|nr:MULTISPECIES: hypothetical protein [unclassified Pseudomonas]MDH1440356.1 hypothetical protein [Pseudomonas sp. GD03722]WGG03554.1 hypothetical protein N5O88_10235 [Pseudomonas sp. GD03721]WGG07722.1 hypothetical protein N5O87_10245 [Pseudomonas sp. GD03919]